MNQAEIWGGGRCLLAINSEHPYRLSPQSLCITIWDETGKLAGGGTFILIRTPNGTTEVIDAREVAPAAANETMFVGAHVAPTQHFENSSQTAHCSSAEHIYSLLPASTDRIRLATFMQCWTPQQPLHLPTQSFACLNWSHTLLHRFRLVAQAT